LAGWDAAGLTSFRIKGTRFEAVAEIKFPGRKGPPIFRTSVFCLRVGEAARARTASACGRDNIIGKRVKLLVVLDGLRMIKKQL
jgi:hypothetical protein